MLDAPDIFAPLSIPWDFEGSRYERLEYQARSRGIALQCRWTDRCNLVTSKIAFLDRDIAGVTEIDLDQLILRLAPGQKRGFYFTSLKEFARQAAEHIRRQSPFLERVVGPFARIHIVPRMSTTALCGQQRVCYDTTSSNVTCRKCLRKLAENHRDEKAESTVPDALLGGADVAASDANVVPEQQQDLPMELGKRQAGE